MSLTQVKSSPWCVVPRYKYLLDIKETTGNIGVDIEKIYYFNDVITNPFVNQVQLALSIHVDVETVGYGGLIVVF